MVTQPQTNVKLSATPPQAQPESQPPPSITPATKPKSTLQDLLQQFIQVKPINNTSSHFTHEGVCTKCGWHTLQLSQKDALQLTTQHVQQHWRLVANQL